jgi:hypothetical protein
MLRAIRGQSARGYDEVAIRGPGALWVSRGYDGGAIRGQGGGPVQ